MEASTKSALHQSSTDGAYGIYVPLGKLKAGETKSAVFYYGVPRQNGGENGKGIFEDTQVKTRFQQQNSHWFMSLPP